jgi:hypothetical protein
MDEKLVILFYLTNQIRKILRINAIFHKECSPYIWDGNGHCYWLEIEGDKIVVDSIKQHYEQKNYIDSTTEV